MSSIAINLGSLAPTMLVRSGVGLLRRAAWVVAGCAILLACWYVVTEKPYRAGSDFGYWLGVVGGSMMLVLLLYPLRKHLRALRKLGGLRYWFAMHMTFGILGPLLILFHTTFHLGSPNSKIAFASMLLVAASGVVGRFIYVRIHHGLYGRAATLDELRASLARSEVDERSLFAQAPRVHEPLLAYHDMALDSGASFALRVARFMTLRLRGRLLLSRLRAPLREALAREAALLGWSKAETRRQARLARREAAEYVAAVCAVAQFQAWKRLFSFWHVAHVPFVFLLVGSGIAHVVAVHLY